MQPVLPDDVTHLVKRWVSQARADAKAAGEFPPPPYSRLPDWQRSALVREARWWHDLAYGHLLASCVPPQPAPADITAMREHLGLCIERLHTRLRSHADLLPTGTHDQLDAVERRVTAALDVVEQAGVAWSRGADAAWQELMLWASRLDLDHAKCPHAKGSWVPDGWEHYVTGS